MEHSDALWSQGGTLMSHIETWWSDLLPATPHERFAASLLIGVLSALAAALVTVALLVEVNL